VTAGSALRVIGCLRTSAPTIGFCRPAHFPARQRSGDGRFLRPGFELPDPVQEFADEHRA